jgi:hypothetical protein
MPGMPMVAALSASRLAGLLLPPGLQRLYVACDADAAGLNASAEVLPQTHSLYSRSFIILHDLPN